MSDLNTDNPAVETPETQTEPSKQESVLEFLKGYEPGAGYETTPTAEPGAAAEPQLILGKFKSTEDLVKAYQEAEKKISEQGQEKSTYEQQLARERADRERFESIARDLYQRQFSQQVNLSQSPEQLDEAKKKWEEKYYEDPYSAVQELLEKERKTIFEQHVQPLQSQVQQAEAQRQFERQYNYLKTQNPDFEALAPEIEKVFGEKPHIAMLPDSLEVAYNLVKSRQAAQAGDPSALLKDQELRAKLKAELGQEVIKEYLEGVKSGKPPAVIGQTGETPSTLPTKISSAADAKKAVIAHLERLGVK